MRILSEAQDSGRLPEQIFFAAESEAHARVDGLIAAVEAAGGDAVRTTPALISKLSGKDNPQSVVGVFREWDVSLEAIERDTAPIWIVAQALRDPGNLGTILRTGDAVGAGGLILIDDCTDPFSVEAVRASMGAIFTQRIAMARWDDFLPWIRGGAGQLIGTSLEGAIDYQEPRYERPAFLLVGNESAGLPADYAAQCDITVKIPMMGRADSLNAAMATAVMAYELLNQFRR